MKLQSVSKGYVVDEQVLNLLNSLEYRSILDFYEDHVHFISERNPTGCWKTVNRYAQEAGTIHKKTVVMENKETGVRQEKEVFDYYEPKDPDEYVEIIYDHCSLVESERGWTLKQCIDKLSEYCAKYLRNRYHFSPIVIQQQAFESEGNDAFKLGRVRPSAVGLGDSKYTSRDANITLGLFSPFRFGITEYFGYDITILKDRIRFLEVITNRDGEMGGILPLYFDGAVCDFRELPKPDDKPALEKIYKHCKALDAAKDAPKAAPNNSTNAPVLLLSITNSIKHFININFKH
jgi:hypothetical protein